MEAREKREPEAARLARVRLLALDVDGVLTDGRIAPGPAGPGDERPAFDVQDGIALRWIQEGGIVVAWISGRGSPAVSFRARELGVAELHLRSVSKRETLREIQERADLVTESRGGRGAVRDLCERILRAQGRWQSIVDAAQG